MTSTGITRVSPSAILLVVAVCASGIGSIIFGIDTTDLDLFLKALMAATFGVEPEV